MLRGRRLWLAIGLMVGIGGGKRIERLTVLIDPHDRWINGEVERIAMRIVNLRHERDVGEPGRIAVTEGAGAWIALEQPLEGVEAAGDPMIIPKLQGLLVMSERPMEIAKHAQIVERMNVAGNDRGERAHASPAIGVAGQERRLRICPVEVFD